MPREVHFTMFGKLIVRLEKEKIKQVLICFAQNAPRLASYLDFEIVNEKHFKKRETPLVKNLLDDIAKRFSTSIFIKELVDAAKEEINSDTFAEKYLTMQNETNNKFLEISS